MPAPRCLAMGLLLCVVAAWPRPGRADESPALPNAQATGSVGYDDGFFLQNADGRYRLRINARLQTRYTFAHIEDATDLSAFSVPRARFGVSGHVGTNRFRYLLMADFGRGNPTLREIFVEYAFVPGWLSLRVGQFKRPFGREQINSSASLTFVDRARTAPAFGGGRDIGLTLANQIERSPRFEWALGLFNGTGITPWFRGDVAGAQVDSDATFTNIPDRFYPMLVARLGYNHGGIKGYRESDLDGGPLRFALGASLQLGFDADGGNDSTVTGEFDAILKAYGFTTSGAFYVRSGQAGSGFSDQDFAAYGLHVQAGYVIGGLIEPGVRYTYIGPAGRDNDQHEVTAGLSLFLWQRHIQWQSDASWLSSAHADGAPTHDWTLRTQLQFVL